MHKEVANVCLSHIRNKIIRHIEFNRHEGGTALSFHGCRKKVIQYMLLLLLLLFSVEKGGKKIQKRVETRAHLANSYILTKFIKGPGKAVLGTKLLQIVPETTHRSMPMFNKAETVHYSHVEG